MNTEDQNIPKNTPATSPNNLAWDRRDQDADLSTFLRVDLGAILHQPNREATVRTIPAQVLYRSMYALEATEAAEVLSLASSDQITRLFDYDAWDRHGWLSRARFFEWIELLHKKGPNLVAETFRNLEEEYQIAALDGIVKAYSEEEVEDDNRIHEDQVIRLGHSDVFYEILLKPESYEFQQVKSLIETLAEKDYEYCVSVLFHTGYAPTGENEALLRQFRSARLEEDGFLTEEESAQYFYPFKKVEYNLDIDFFTESLARGAKTIVSQSTSIIDSSSPISDELFFDKVIQHSMSQDSWPAERSFTLQLELLTLANGICAINGMTPNEISGLGRLLAQAKNIVSIGLEQRSDNDINVGIHVLNNESIKTIFRTGISVIHALRLSLVEILQGLVPENTLDSLQDNIVSLKFEASRHIVDRSFPAEFDIITKEQIKSLLTRFPSQWLSIEGDDNRLKSFPICSLDELKAVYTRIKDACEELQLRSLSKGEEDESH